MEHVRSVNELLSNDLINNWFLHLHVPEITVTEITLFIMLFFRQPEVFDCLETTTSAVDNPVQVTNYHMQPVVKLETLNLSK